MAAMSYNEADSPDQIVRSSIAVEVKHGDKMCTVTCGYQGILSLNTRRTVVLLHGIRFSSQEWVDLHTLQLIASWGYNALALDLPYKTELAEINSASADVRATVLQHVFETLSIHKPVIVAPSMSGLYAIPYICRGKEPASQRVSGFIPVAPLATEENEQFMPSVDIPTLIVYGSQDSRFKIPHGPNTCSILQKIPNHKVYVMEDAGHACYLAKPDEWHGILKKFLTDLSW